MRTLGDKRTSVFDRRVLKSILVQVEENKKPRDGNTHTQLRHCLAPDRGVADARKKIAGHNWPKSTHLYVQVRSDDETEKNSHPPRAEIVASERRQQTYFLAWEKGEERQARTFAQGLGFFAFSNDSFVTGKKHSLHYWCEQNSFSNSPQSKGPKPYNVSIGACIAGSRGPRPCGQKKKCRCAKELAWGPSYSV